jgi:hypothetical protein
MLDVSRLLAEGSALGRAAREFYTGLRVYYPAEASIEHALTAVERGIMVLEAAKQWWAASG